MSSDSFGGIPGSGPLQRGNRDHRGGPPILADYPDSPQYDLTTVVQLLGVRPMTLWSWQQQLGMSPPELSRDGAARRYSERELVACLWLRDQLLRGVTVAQAADTLVRAQPQLSDLPNHDTTSATGDLPAQMGDAALAAGDARFAPAALAAQAAATPLVPAAPPALQATPPPAMSQPALWNTSQQPGTSSPPRPIPSPLRPPVYSGPLRSVNPSGPLRSANPSGPLRAPVNSGPLRPSAYTVPLYPTVGTGASPNPPYTAGPQSGPLRGGPSGVLGTGALVAPSGSRWPIPTAPSGRELRSMVQPLVRAFASFDTYTAARLVDDAIGTRNVEIACLGLLLPALSRVAELGAHRQMSNPEQHFAINFVRARLFSVFDASKERLDAPIVFVACAPREMDDVGALALATCWRRAGLRVIFLGQDTDEHDLVREAYIRRPQLICVCVNSSQRVRALARIAKGIMHLEGHGPVFTYIGAPFARNPELQRRVTGVYLGDDPATATWHALRLLGVDARNGAPPTMPATPGVEYAG